MKNGWGTLVLLCVGINGAAMAADLPTRPAYKAPVAVAPAFNWSGFYWGVSAGYGWGDPNRSFAGLPNDTIVWVNYNPVVNGLASPDVNGFIGGGQIGYNAQYNTVVLGL